MRPSRKITVRTTTLPRPGGRARSLVRLDPESRRRYGQAVAPVTARIERSLGPNVLAARARWVDPAGAILLGPWRPARRRFHVALERWAASSACVAITDVRACYASIGDEVLASRLRDLGCARGDIERILRLLEGIHDGGVAGLPVGPEPSAVLANAVLSTVDDAVAAPGVRHLRWVDDLVVFTRDDASARRALERAGNALAELGLETAPEKTMIVDAREAPRTIGGRLSMARAPRARPL